MTGGVWGWGFGGGGARDAEKQEHWTNFTVTAERERKDKRAKGQNWKVVVIAERLQKAAPAHLLLPLFYVSIRQRDREKLYRPTCSAPYGSWKKCNKKYAKN